MALDGDLIDLTAYGTTVSVSGLANPMIELIEDVECQLRPQSTDWTMRAATS